MIYTDWALYTGENVIDKDNDKADWFETYEDAHAAAEAAFNAGETKEAYILGFDANGDCEDFGRSLTLENGTICEYENGERLWL